MSAVVKNIDELTGRPYMSSDDQKSMKFDVKSLINNISVTHLLMLGLVVFIGWASLFEIDQTVRATGQIIPSARTQIIQAADGGVLAELLVHEGQSVSAGQKLAVLEKERVNAAYDASRAKVAELSASLIRAKAESEGEYPIYGQEFENHSDFVIAQINLFEQRKMGLEDELGIIEDSLSMAQKELRMSQSLLRTGDISRLEVMRAKRQVNELMGKKSAVLNKYLQTSRQEQTKLEAELTSAKYKLDERSSMLKHTELVAPVPGIVKYLKINTVGGVLRAGDELMQISPTDSEMVIEVDINPTDIGDLALGMPVTIKLDAFDYSIYGSLRGTLTYISSDTLTQVGSDDRTTSFYRARVKLDDEKNKLNKKLASVPLKPGMTATIDVQTNTRTILEYLAKPVFKAFGGAMNER
ncbi:MAG: HlyD family efflux transporter periplasmic adaptor subunit [Sedimenticola sp.]